MDWPELDGVLAELPADASALEVGTGHGSLFGYLLTLLAGGGHWRVTTIDASAAAVSAAEARLSVTAPAVRRRVAVHHVDVIDFAATRAGIETYPVVVASALLSAVPLTRAWSLDDVLRALAELVRPGGTLLLEDYLPLMRSVADSDIVRDQAPSLEAARAARQLWRWYKAVAELGGHPHYEEVPPGWVRARLLERGFRAVEVSSDDRQMPRGPDDLRMLHAERITRPESIDQGLWFALDRYRRDRLRTLADAGGLVQWSGWYRIRATR